MIDLILSLCVSVSIILFWTEYQSRDLLFGFLQGTGSPLPGSAIPTVGHWGGLGLGLGLVMVRVRRTVGMADPGNGGPESSTALGLCANRAYD